MDKYAHITDKEIVLKIVKEGKRELLNVLYDRYADKIYYKCISLTKDRETSKDLAHDIIVKVFLNIAKYKGISPFSLWVHSISYNHCIDYLRKQKRIRYTEYDEGSFENIVDNELELKQLKEIKLDKLEELMDIINPSDKIILLMRYQDDLPIKRIATMLEISESATKMRLKRARSRLAQLYNEQTNSGNNG